MPLTLGDHAALSRHMSTTVMQVAHRHAYARHYKRYVYTAPRLTTITTGSITTRMAVRCFKCAEHPGAKVVHDNFARTKRVIPSDPGALRFTLISAVFCP